jgi:lysozyme family protein|tara:strand:+ start:17439 stop:17864 length:426 start_codon:yes stop_codon:yes gene_type:complete
MVMQTVRQIAQQIVDREGGYVDAPEDPGGATNFGVTIYTMRRLGLELDHDGNVDKHDVQMLSRAQAVDIFIKHYFEGPLISQLPQPLQATVFDMYVNAGGNAVRILQRLLIDIGFEVVVDGALGLQSIAAFKATFENAGAI